MIRNIVPLSLVAAAFWCGAAYAQENSEAAQTGTEQAAQDDLDLGETGPRIGEQYLKEEAGDWAVLCINTETDNDPCGMRQILNGQQGQPIAEVTIEKVPEGSVAVARALVVVPLETLLQAQLSLSIDDAPGKRYNYHHCNQVGCVAQLGLTQGDVDAMKAGTKAKLSLVPVRAPDQILEMEVSLSGFTSGFDQLQANVN